MRLVQYLETIYGYDTPIFLKDVKIGRKSKAAVKEAFYRATKKGELVKESCGVYSIPSKKEFAGVFIRDIIEQKYIYNRAFYPNFKMLGIEGYYAGVTFLNEIKLSEQVPAILEITTNNTTSNKRLVTVGKTKVIVRKSKVKITFQNYKALQFFDMFSFLSTWEVIENKDFLTKYIIDNSISKKDFADYIHYFSFQTLKKITDGGLLNAFV